MSPSTKYWWRFLVGQWLGFCWFWDQRTSGSQLARQKLGKKNTPQPWWPPPPHGHYGASSLAPQHTTGSPHIARQVYVVKTRVSIYYYFLFAILRHGALSMCSACVCWLCWLLAANFGQEKILATHPCTFGHWFRLAEPGRIAIGCRYRWRLKPCLGRFCGCFIVAVCRNYEDSLIFGEAIFLILFLI